MIKIFKTKLVVLVMAFFLFEDNAYTEIKNSIIAKIGNEIITHFDVENKIKTNLYLSGEEINQENVNKIKALTLKSLINLKLKSNEIKKHNLTSNDQAIAQYLDTIAKNLNLSRVDLINQFKINEIDYDQFVEDVKTEFLWQRLVARTYLDRIKVNEDQINLELKEILEKEKKSKNFVKYNLSEIEIIFETSKEENDLKNKIDDDIKKIGFKKTAIKYSTSATALNGGLIGWIDSNLLSSIYFSVVKNLQIGQVSRPIKKGNTITFLKLNDKKEFKKSQNIDLEQLKISIENNKKNELLNLYSSSHLSKIKNTTLIEFL
jgi:peptidyl-prolyl cis-trans isomerase SurA